MKAVGDKIEFPFNNEMYLKQAAACIEKNDYEQARQYVEKAYETDKSYQINHFFTFILFTLERYEQALEVANEFKDLYLENEQHILMYTMLLIKNHQFLEAEVIIQNHRTEAFLFLDQEWENLERELSLERELVNFEIEMKRKATKNKLSQISNYSLIEQTKIIEDARLLTLDDLQEVAVQVFNNPFVAGHIQRGFLEVLIEMGDENYYTFSWFNQMKKICPNRLSLFNQLPIVQEMDDILEDKLQKNPSLFEVIKAEIINDLLLLYPFVEETITDRDYWIDLYIAQFDDSNQNPYKLTPSNPEQEELTQWMQQLNQIAQRN